MRPEVLIGDEPTRGIDRRARNSEIHGLLRDLAAAGVRRDVISFGNARDACIARTGSLAMYHGRIMRGISAAELTRTA